MDNGDGPFPHDNLILAAWTVLRQVSRKVGTMRDVMGNVELLAGSGMTEQRTLKPL
jgi:hypothetical protein